MARLATGLLVLGIFVATTAQIQPQPRAAAAVQIDERASSSTNLSLDSVPKHLVQSAFNALIRKNDGADGTVKHHQRGDDGKLVAAQKLTKSPYVIHRLTLNLDPGCKDEACLRELCTLDVRTHERSETVDVPNETIHCRTLQDPGTDGQVIENIEKQIIINHSPVSLDREVQISAEHNDRPFVAVKATQSVFCPGCPYELNPSLPGLSAFGDLVLEAMDESGVSDYKHKLVSIVRVTRAVPPGLNVVQYQLLMEIGESNCLKTSLIKISECQLQSNLPVKSCLVTFDEHHGGIRKITKNNCTDLLNTDNEVNADPNSLFFESTAAAGPSVSKEEDASSTKAEFYDQIAQEAQEVFRVPSMEISTVKDISSEEVPKFTEKMKEFDEFLKDFEVSVKTEKTTTPENLGVPVTEELIKPERVKDDNNEEDVSYSSSSAEPTVEAVRSKRSVASKTLLNNKAMLNKVAEKAVQLLDEKDKDNKRTRFINITDFEVERKNHATVLHLTVKIADTDCSENNQLTECLDEVIGPARTCKLWLEVNEKKPLDSPKLAYENCLKNDEPEQETRYKRSAEDKLPVLGGHSSVEINDEIRDYAKQGLQLYTENHYKGNNKPVHKIISATKQVVAGFKYRIIVEFSETDCDKNAKEADNCQLKSDGQVERCTVQALVQSWISEKPNITVESCSVNNRRKRNVEDKPHLVGGEKSIEINENITKWANQGLQLYTDTQYKGNNKPVHKIISATSQVVAGIKYRIIVEFSETDCDKNAKDTDNCLLKSNGQVERCTVQVWTQAWLNKEEVTIESCSGNKRRKRSLRGQNYSQKMLTQSRQFKEDKLFGQFISAYNKNYPTEEEKQKRFKIFKENLDMIEELQRNEQGTGRYGVTQFSDLTKAEFKERYLGLNPSLRAENDLPLPRAKIPNIELPMEYDWRHYNVVTPVKNQGQCGSCWAFSVTGNVEGQYAIKHGKLLSLSEQELVDCDKFDQGCGGGLPDSAYKALEEIGGLETESDYPYEAENEQCHFNQDKVKVRVISGVNITSNETEMAQWLVQNGPMSIGINANAMQFYMGGVSHPFHFLCNPNDLDHGVLIVGYGIKSYPIFKKKLPYWLIKNSWGPHWGEQGYYRVYRGDGSCGVNKMVTSAVVA